MKVLPKRLVSSFTEELLLTFLAHLFPIQIYWTIFTFASMNQYHKNAIQKYIKL